MKILILILSFLSLILGSCGTPPLEGGVETESRLPTILATDRPTDTPAPSITLQASTPTPTAFQTDTPTALLPTATHHPSETPDLPSLIAGQPVTITQISMIDATNGWAIGHQNRSGDQILYTQDGGFSWEQRTPPIPGPSEQNADSFQMQVYFHDARTAWAINLSPYPMTPINTPVVWRTSDGGRTWDPSDPLPLTGAESYFIPENFSFIDPSQGWLLVHIDAGMSHDYSSLYATSDGGKTWQKLIDPYREGLQSLYNTGMTFADSNFGWVAKDNLAVLPGAFIEQTRDGGLTWENVFLPTPADLDWFNEISQCATLDPTFLEVTRGIILINCHTFDEQTFAYTYLSSDMGQSWQSVTLPTPAHSLFFINSQVGWAFGRDLYQSTDGGLSWVKIKTVNWDGQFSFVDENTGWAVATAGEAIALVFTQDGGRTWQQIKPTIK
jgi:photosystem II stability/assembly factor-like uncharacterized protein